MRSLWETALWFVGGSGAIIGYIVYRSNPIVPLESITPKAAFEASRLTDSTFLLREYDDIFSEHPHIYAKVVLTANTILVIDTGCGGRTNDSGITIRSLREFIEEVGVKDNGGLPLNQGRKMDYVVALTHCHYDHILGVEDFKDSLIVASSNDPVFLESGVLPDHSLCKALGIATPKYTPTLVQNFHKILSPLSHVELGVAVLHTPGHTPDEIALYDETEMMLYVGDTLYEYEPIIFPKQGSIVTWFRSINFLIDFVKQRNNHVNAPAKEVLINAGHRTVLQPALDVLMRTRLFMEDVVSGREQVKERGRSGGLDIVSYEQAGGRLSLRCPENLILEARQSNDGVQVQ